MLDLNAEALGVPVASLMERAGEAVAARAAALAPEGPIVVLVGPGNNGGDGLVAARHLADAGRRVRVLAVPQDASHFRSREARHAFERLPATVGIGLGADERAVAAALPGAALVADALLGVGVSGPLREPYAGIVRAVAAARVPVLAVDVPTGLGTPAALRATATVTFHDAKAGMTREACGEVSVADIGMPAKAWTHTGPGEFALYPRASREQHKGEGGIVLIVGGGPYTGAPAVAGLSALRAGADLAIILTPRRAWPIVAGYSPNLVVRPLNRDDLDFDDPENRVTLNLWLKKASSVVIGPGLGLMGSTMRSVQHVVDRAVREGKRVVVDADAIAAIAEKRDVLSPSVLVTPHKREFRTLVGRDVPNDEAKRPEAARAAAAELKCNILLKGPVDVITDGERVKESETGHPAMSVGGTGDAVAGVAGALLAKGLSPFDAARLTAYWVGKAGEVAVREKSYGLLATDVVEALPAVLRTHLP